MHQQNIQNTPNWWYVFLITLIFLYSPTWKFACFKEWPFPQEENWKWNWQGYHFSRNLHITQQDYTTGPFTWEQSCKWVKSGHLRQKSLIYALASLCHECSFPWPFLLTQQPNVYLPTLLMASVQQREDPREKQLYAKLVIKLTLKTKHVHEYKLCEYKHILSM